MTEHQNQAARLSALGEAVRMRRVQRGMATREEFAERVNLTYRVLTDLENGARRLGPKSYRKIEETLDWPPGSCEAILIGGWSTTTIDAIDQRAAFLDTAQPRPVNHAVIDEIALAAPARLICNKLNNPT